MLTTDGNAFATAARCDDGGVDDWIWGAGAWMTLTAGLDCGLCWSHSGRKVLMTKRIARAIVVDWQKTSQSFLKLEFIDASIEDRLDLSWGIDSAAQACGAMGGLRSPWGLSPVTREACGQFFEEWHFHHKNHGIEIENLKVVQAFRYNLPVSPNYSRLNFPSNKVFR